LTIAVPAKHADLVREAFGRGFVLHPTDNASVRAAMPRGYARQILTSGMCSCGLYTRPILGGGRDGSHPTERLRAKYVKRGWSETKIARAIEQATHKEPKKPIPGLQPDVVERLQTLCEAAGEVAL